MDYNNRLYTSTYYFFNYLLRFYDFAKGTDFSFIDNSVIGNGREPYYATPVASFAKLKRCIDRNLDRGSGHNILDIGCGKGLMLYFFSHFGFERISGIEYDKRLSRVARKNLKRLKSGNVDIFNGDARLFRKYSDYDVFYLYNPFDRDTLCDVIKRIITSLDKAPRPLYLFYCNPRYETVLTDHGFREADRFYYKTKFFVYE